MFVSPFSSFWSARARIAPPHERLEPVPRSALLRRSRSTSSGHAAREGPYAGPSQWIIPCLELNETRFELPLLVLEQADAVVELQMPCGDQLRLDNRDLAGDAGDFQFIGHWLSFVRRAASGERYADWLQLADQRPAILPGNLNPDRAGRRGARLRLSDIDRPHRAAKPPGPGLPLLRERRILLGGARAPARAANGGGLYCREDLANFAWFWRSWSCRTARPCSPPRCSPRSTCCPAGGSLSASAPAGSRPNSTRS